MVYIGRWLVRNAKNGVTLGALSCSWYACFRANAGTQESSVFVIFAWLLDAIDGPLARFTHSADEFGERFDNLVDLFSYSVAPAAIAAAHYGRSHAVLAFISGFSLIAGGTIRLVRYDTEALKREGYWVGLPRPASGLAVTAFLNVKYADKGYGAAALFVLLVVLLVLNLSYVPYPNHRLKLSIRVQRYLLLALIGFGMFGIFNFWMGLLSAMLAYAALPLLMRIHSWSCLRGHD